MNKQVAIELKQVSFSYEGYETKVLEGANFTLEYGSVALLSGFSGEGKSTVLSLIAGIIPNLTPGNLEGEVWIDGENIAGQKTKEVCKKVGVVLQNADAQIIHSIVEDEIAFGCENYGFCKEKTEQCIQGACQKMGLAPHWKTRTLSGGQKQRLITATTLATEQKILVLDEPLANLDVAGAKQLLETLQELAKEGYAVLLVEHRIDLVLPYVDEVWRIHQGKILKVDNPKQYLQSQVGCMNCTCACEKCKDTAYRLSGIGCKFEEREVLRDISFEVKKGERILLLGENGCGKTTLMRMLARLAKPTKGRLHQEIHTKAGKWCRPNAKWFEKVGVVCQNPNYQLFMPTVWQEISFSAESEEYAKEMMERFGLTALAGRHPHSLSEGQKRRLSIAAVLAAKPEVLLLDEPTVGQDYEGLRKMVEILNEIHEETKNTMFTITHDMRCAKSLCDVALLVEDGEIAKVGGPEMAVEYFTAISR